MYRTYELTEEEKNKITRMRWDGDTHYYDVFESQEECDEEEKRLVKIDEEYRKQKENYLKSMNANWLLLFWQNEVNDMDFRLTSESMGLLIESIIDAVEFIDDRDMQFKLVKTILEDNGIIEIKEWK